MRPLFDQRFCKKPRALETYKIPPRSKLPPSWQRAQSFIKQLIIAQIGLPPYFYGHNGGPPAWANVTRYQRVYAAMRDDYRVQDFPINP